MTEIISYRLSSTGMWGYSYYQGQEYIGETTCMISTSSNVRIIGDDITWYSQFKIDTDIVPGIILAARSIRYCGQDRKR